MAEAKKNNKSEKSMFKYVPVYPQAPMDKKYHYYDGDVLKVNEDLCELVTDPKRLKEIFDSWEGKKIAIDTETTGLTFFQDFIVGFSVAADKDYGIYVPLRHQIRRTDKVKEVLTDPETGEPLLTKRGAKRTHTVEKHTDFDNPVNMDVKVALDMLWDLMSKAKINVFFNLEFDLTMLKNEGYDVIKAGFPVFDTSIMTYLYDAENRNWNNLKACSAIVLGRKPTKFEEALGGAANFRYVDLSKGYPYAACDACHDEQTEVLTKDGWILWKNYDGITPLATPNLEKDCMEWQVPTRIIKYKYNGIMKHAITRNQDWMVTPNHSMLVYTAQNCTRPVLRKQADALNFYEAMYTGPKSSTNPAMDYTFGEYKLTEVDVARLTAMVLADGCTSHPSKENHQRKSVNITLSTCKNWDILKGFLDSLPFKNSKLYKCPSSSKTYQWNLFNNALWELLHESCGAGSANKYIPQFIKDMTAEGIFEFVKFYSYCDGYTNYGAKGHLSTEICTVSTKMKDDLQELLTTIGIHNVSTFRPAKDSCIDGRPIKKENCKDQWLIYYKNSKTIGIKQTQIFDEMYDGFVYCAEVPNHTLVTRRNGRVLVSGNCNTIGIYETLGPEVRKLLGNATPTPIIIDGATKPYSVYHRDNELICAFTDYYHHVTLPINMETAKAYKKKAQEDLAKAEAEIYSYFDMGNFNLSTSSKDFKNAMVKAGIDTGLKTETGNVSYGKKGIENMTRKLRAFKEILRGFKYIDYDGDKINKRKSPNELKLVEFITFFGRDMFKFKDTVNFLQHIRTKEDIKMTKMEFFEELKLLYKRENQKLHILKVIQNRSSLAKAINSYIEKLATNESCHMHYNLKGTASGRLSSGNGSKNEKKKNHYFIDLNAQNLTKPTPAFYKARRSDEPGNIIGWVFDPVTEEYMHEHPDELIVEGFSPENNIRNCLVAPEGRYIASLDYSAQEYRALAILSKDHKMLENFKQGLDPHTATAYAVWGKEHYDKKKRKKAKACIGEDVLLLTNNGYKTGDELDINTDLLVDMHGNTQNWARTIEYRDLVRVTYDNGVTETYTPDHRVHVWNGREIVWKQIQDLDSTDNVVQYVGLYDGGKTTPEIIDYTDKVLRRNKSSETSFNINTKEFAYLAGIYLGDGNLMKYPPSRGENLVNKPRGISYCVEPEMLETTLSFLKSFNLVPTSVSPIGRNGKVYQVRINNVAWATLIRDLFGSTDTKHADDRFRQLWTRETWAYFLAGLLDTDGYTRGGRTEFASTVQPIIKAISTACSIVGVKYHLEHKTAKYKGKPYPYLNLVLYSIPKLPQLVTRKTVRGSNSRQCGWNLSEEDARYWRSKYIEWGDNYWSKYYTTFNNVIKNNAKLVESTLDVIRSRIPDFSIQPNMACVHVVNKEETHGKTFIIQTTNHLYATMGTGNANCNFLMNYCGGPKTLAENLDVPFEEAANIIDGYNKAFFECVAWKKRVQKQVIEKQDGVIYSVFGRPRQFKSVLSTSFRLKAGTKEFASIPASERAYKGDAIYKAVERKIISHAIQGCCGDICRWDLIRLYRRFFKNRDPHIDFYSTVHDEINFSIDKDKIIEYVREIDDIMTIHNLSKDLPIVTSIDLGNTLGMLFPFEWEDETRTNLVPIKA